MLYDGCTEFSKTPHQQQNKQTKTLIQNKKKKLKIMKQDRLMFKCPTLVKSLKAMKL